MKKKLALLLACTMALGLTACGGSKPAAAPETTAAATEAAAESSEESKADEKTEAAGGDMDALIEAAKADTERPSLIVLHTQIGYGCPAKQGKASAHGEPLGEENIIAMKET